MVICDNAVYVLRFVVKSRRDSGERSQRARLIAKRQVGAGGFDSCVRQMRV